MKLKVKKERREKKCSYCHEKDLNSETVVICSKCNAMHHFECWTENKGYCAFCRWKIGNFAQHFREARQKYPLPSLCLAFIYIVFSIIGFYFKLLAEIISLLFKILVKAVKIVLLIFAVLASAFIILSFL